MNGATRRGLVLGGGGVLGAAWMVGALQALQDQSGLDVRDFDAFVGTSAGSILAALLGAGVSVTDLVNLSQVVLCLELPLAMFPLLQFTSSRKRMGRWRNGWLLLITGWGSAILITAMDLYTLPDALREAWRVIVGH